MGVGVLDVVAMLIMDGGNITGSAFGDTKRFDMEIDGNIVKMLTASNPAGGGAYARMGSSLELVAGAGFEPATFRL